MVYASEQDKEGAVSVSRLCDFKNIEVRAVFGLLFSFRLAAVNSGKDTNSSSDAPDEVQMHRCATGRQSPW